MYYMYMEEPYHTDVERRAKRLKELHLETNHYGCLVNKEATAWFVCFVPGLDKQWWHPLVHKNHKHCFAMQYSGGNWTIFEPWWTRMLVTNISHEQAVRFLLWGIRGDVLLVPEHVPGKGGQMRGWMNCAGLVSYLLGRPYFVWTPHSLFNKLLCEPEVRIVDCACLITDNAEINIDELERLVSAQPKTQPAPQHIDQPLYDTHQNVCLPQ